MPDWKPEIRQRLAKLQLAPTREAAIVEELAQHLDESYAELLASGVSEADAYRRARAELHDGGLLTHRLQRVERSTNPEPIVLGTNRRTKYDCRPVARPTPRRANIVEEARLHLDCRHHAGAQHWGDPGVSQPRALLLGACDVAQGNDAGSSANGLKASLPPPAPHP
jgi:hypothetical protein